MSDITDTTLIYLYSLWCHPISELAGNWQAEGFVFWCGDPTSAALQKPLENDSARPFPCSDVSFDVI